MLSENKKYILLNFAYGYGPFLRATELALAINDFLEKKNIERFGIIIPLVYGENQKRIMKEEFGNVIEKYPNEILLDENLGGYLNSIFYGEKNYEESLRYFLEHHKAIEKEIRDYLHNGLVVKNFAGDTYFLKRKFINLEINRCPRINFGIEPCYYTSFAYISEIFERSLIEDDIKIDKGLMEKIIPLYTDIEKKQNMHFIAEPATFSYLGYSQKYGDEIFTPPNETLPKPVSHCVEKGIYVTITGIPGLDNLFKEAVNIGLKIYTNKPEAIPFSQKALPEILGHKNILLHFARSGWGSIWLSQFTETPFITPSYNSDDDPEIYFNNICIEKIGLGKVYRGQSLKELLEFSEEYKTNVKKINTDLMEKYRTLNGINYIAEKIVDHYLSS